MNRKPYKGQMNDKEKSKQRLIDAVGTVIKSKGYAGLNATNISKAAGLDRRLITLYFGTLDTLVETYIRGNDYWISASGDALNLISNNKGENTKEILEALLYNQLEYFWNDTEMQKIVLWQISKSTEIMKEICDEREMLSKHFFSLSDIELAGIDIDLRAISALLVAGIYYLVLHAKSTDSTFCEIDLKSQEGLERIRKAISVILRKAYEAQ